MTKIVVLLAILASPANAVLNGPVISTAAFVSPSTATFAGMRGPVGAIAIDRGNVFDPRIPGEDWWPFRIANKIHIPTKEYVVRRELLIRPGDPWDSLKGLESERNLRATDFLRKAEITPSRSASGDRLDLLVRTQDSWTTLPQASIGTEGGDRYLIFGMEEDNLLGYGKQVSYYHAQVGPDVRTEYRYNDPQFRGSRYHFTTLYGATENGDTVGAFVNRPFFALDTPYAVQVLWARIIQQDVLLQNADILSKFLQTYRTVDAQYGIHLPGTAVRRLHAGFHYEHDHFGATADTTPGTLPSNRDISGPTIGYSWIQPRYVKETYIDKMARVEDFNMGNEFALLGGAMMKSFGSDADRWTLNAIDQQGLRIGEGRFAMAQAGVYGRMRAGDTENAIFFANLNLFWKTVWLIPQTWVAHTEWNTTRALDRENQLILGGNTGLRGYKNGSFTGARTALINFEDRFFLTHEFFHLFLVGAAVFTDIGAVAPEGGSLTEAQFKSDVGAGFRFGSTRSTSGSVVRMDVAYALSRGPGPSRWVVSIRGGQAFEIFNSTIRKVVHPPSTALSSESAGDRLRRQ